MSAIAEWRARAGASRCRHVFFCLRSMLYIEPPFLRFFGILQYFKASASMVTHLSGPSCLTSVILRELVFLTWYGRSPTFFQSGAGSEVERRIRIRLPLYRNRLFSKHFTITVTNLVRLNTFFFSFEIFQIWPVLAEQIYLYFGTVLSRLKNKILKNYKCLFYCTPKPNPEPEAEAGADTGILTEHFIGRVKTSRFRLSP